MCYHSLGIILYLLSFIGDLFDGMAARKFNQTSKFGGLLDMVTDRCATLGLLFVLSHEIPRGALVSDNYYYFFQEVLVALVEIYLKNYALGLDK